MIKDSRNSIDNWLVLLSQGRLRSTWYPIPSGYTRDSGCMSDHLVEKDPSQGDDFLVAPSPELSPDVTHAK